MEQVFPESPLLTAKTVTPGWGSVQVSLLPGSRGHLLSLGHLTAAQFAPGRLIKLGVAHTHTRAHTQTLLPPAHTHTETCLPARVSCDIRARWTEPDPKTNDPNRHQDGSGESRWRLRPFEKTGTETMAAPPHAANDVSHFRGGAFYLAPTHRRPSDLTAPFVMGIR